MSIAEPQQRIGRTTEESEPRWAPQGPEAPAGAPNIVVIILDDVGFAQFSSFGASIRTPNIDRLASEGVRFTNFHTNAVCSPTRASLLTGRNCHSVGFGHVSERVNGYPGYSMRLPDSAATVAEILKMNGYSTLALGKWHLTPSIETGPQGPFDRWPLGRGFQRYYGFLGGNTDQFAPELVRDNTPVMPPASIEEGYHLSEDLVDEGIRRIGELKSVAPKRPFMLYLSFGAAHAPHQAPAQWREQYRGAFDHGWDVERERVLQRQIELGVVPPDTELPPSNPGVEPWESLSDDERLLYARMMEAYAGFMSHTDAQIGRLVDYLEQIGQLDDTVIMFTSDNGASGEGGPEGSVDEGLYLNDQPQRASDGLKHLEDIGGPRLYNHYPWGWAQVGNTPYRWYKQFTHAGGITNGLIVRWGNGEVVPGSLRRQYHHVIDVTPTILEIVGVEMPQQLRGVPQQPMHGVSMRYAFTGESADSRRISQHYEMWGNRGYWRDGWMAVCRLQPDAAGSPTPAPMIPFDELRWELYDHRSDPSEINDVADEHPELLREMIDEWWAAAGRYHVLPVDTRSRAARWPVNPPQAPGSIPGKATFLGPGGPYERGVAPKLSGSSFRLSADLTVGGETAQGVLYAMGGSHGGYHWYLAEGSVHFEVAQSSVRTSTVSAPVSLSGRHRLEVRLQAEADLSGEVGFFLDGRQIGGGPVEGLLKRTPIGIGRTSIGYALSSTVSGAVIAPARLSAVLHSLEVDVLSRSETAEADELLTELHDQ